MSDYAINSVTSARAVDAAQTAAPAPGAAAQSAAAAAAGQALPVLSGAASQGLQNHGEQASARQGAQASSQTEVAAAAQKQAAAQKAEEQNKSAETTDKKELPLRAMDKVTIRFSVDDKTNNITVYVIDKASRRVLRAIPPEDLNKMAAGDLLQLMA